MNFLRKNVDFFLEIVSFFFKIAYYEFLGQVCLNKRLARFDQCSNVIKDYYIRKVKTLGRST